MWCQNKFQHSWLLRRGRLSGFRGRRNGRGRVLVCVASLDRQDISPPPETKSRADVALFEHHGDGVGDREHGLVREQHGQLASRGRWGQRAPGGTSP